MPEVTSLTSSPTVTFLTLYLPASASFPSAPRPLHHLLTFVVLQGSMILTHTSPPSPSSVLFSVRKSCNYQLLRYRLLVIRFYSFRLYPRKAGAPRLGLRHHDFQCTQTMINGA